MNKQDKRRNRYMLEKGPLASRGYDWWWHSFTGKNEQTGEEKSFFIEYFIINPVLGGEHPVFGQLPGTTNKPSYVMIKAGHWGENAKQIHRFYGIDHMKMRSEQLDLVVGDCTLSETSMKGSVALSKEECEKHPEYMSDSGQMSWDLKIDKQVAFHVGYGAASMFRAMNAFEMFWHAEGMKTEYEGTVILDGVTYTISPKTSYGYADKNWGGDFTSPWVWLSSCNLISKISGRRLENSVFDVGGGKPKVFGVPLDRKLLIDFYYEGQSYEFNFSKFWTFTRTKFDCHETDDEIVWNVSSQNSGYAIEIEISCPKNEMLLVNYEAPNGKKLHNRLWNGGTGRGEIKLYKKQQGSVILIDHLMTANVGCEYGEYDS
ncbi:tocopherol cyclase family protein [Paenibacillus sp. FSL R5-0341]|uniref:tocopherol cyclase family protein n=1 Tax=Paenibacillus sp. FSL R5-0341 TaxID=2921636 RepID=UPI0030CC30CE